MFLLTLTSPDRPCTNRYILPTFPLPASTIPPLATSSDGTSIADFTGLFRLFPLSLRLFIISFRPFCLLFFAPWQMCSGSEELFSGLRSVPLLVTEGPQNSSVVTLRIADHTEEYVAASVGRQRSVGRHASGHVYGRRVAQGRDGRDRRNVVIPREDLIFVLVDVRRRRDEVAVGTADGILRLDLEERDKSACLTLSENRRLV